MSLASCVAPSRSTTLFTTLEHGIWGCLISFSWAMVIHIWFTLECENYVFSDQEDAVLRPIPSSSHQWTTEECFLALQSWLLGSDETPSSEQSSCVCRSCSFTLVLSVCHLCVSPPFAQGSDEVPFPSWNLLTWWEGVLHGTFQPPLLQGFRQCVSPRTFLHQFPEHSHFYAFLKHASYLSRVSVAPNLFLQLRYFSRLQSLTLSSP